MKISIIIPTYNERENLERLVNEIFSLSLKDYLQIIIVDDNSPDGTGRIAEKLSEKYPQRLIVIHRPQKLGLGTAYKAGFEKALALGSDLILTMDADWSHHPQYFPQFIASQNSAEVIIGSRYIKGGQVRGWKFPRKILSKGANLISRIILGLEIHDNTTGYRCYQRKVLEKINFNKIESEGYSFLIEMMFLCQEAGFKIKEIPIIFENRRKGKSKISQEEIWKAIKTVLRLGLRRRV